MIHDDPIPSPRFTGIFIPVEILELHDLSYLEIILLSWIDALYCKKHKGCFASNSYLAARLRSQPNTIVKALSSLRNKSLIEDVSFDGRTRVIRSNIHRLIDKEQSQSHAECDLNPMQKGRVGQKSQSTCDKNPKPTYIESKDKSKDKHICADSVDAKDNPTLKEKSIKKAENVTVTESEHSKLVTTFGESLTLKGYEELSEWKKSATPAQVKKHSSDYYRLRKWVIPDLMKPSSKGANTPQTEINRDFASKASKSFKAQHYEINIAQDSVFFIPLSSANGFTFSIPFKDHGFKDQLKNEMQKRGFLPTKTLG